MPKSPYTREDVSFASWVREYVAFKAPDGPGTTARGWLRWLFVWGPCAYGAVHGFLTYFLEMKDQEDAHLFSVVAVSGIAALCFSCGYFIPPFVVLYTVDEIMEGLRRCRECRAVVGCPNCDPTLEGARHPFRAPVAVLRVVVGWSGVPAVLRCRQCRTRLCCPKCVPPEEKPEAQVRVGRGRSLCAWAFVCGVAVVCGFIAYSVLSAAPLMWDMNPLAAIIGIGFGCLSLRYAIGFVHWQTMWSQKQRQLRKDAEGRGSSSGSN